MDENELIEATPPQEPRAKAPGWIWIALVGAIIVSLGCGLAFGGAGGYLLGRKTSRGGGRHAMEPECPMRGWGEMPGWKMPGIPDMPRVPRSPGLPRGREEREFHFELPMMSGGAMVVDVLEDTPAQRAGLEIGDIIVAVDGEELGEERTLADAIQEHRPGEVVILEVMREMETIQIEVRLAEHPERRGAGFLGVNVQQMPSMRGMERFIVPQE